MRLPSRETGFDLANSLHPARYRDNADDCADDTAAPTVDRPQLGRSLETAGYLVRNWKFESIPLQR
jgi:hypothetical protein